MDPLTDLDRALREALQVEPSGDFAARIRTRLAGVPRQSHAPKFAFAAATCVVLVVVAAGVWRETTPLLVPSPVLAHRDLIMLSEPPRVLPSPPPREAPPAPAAFHAGHVMVSRSEMLALQRLFAGVTVAPAPNAVAEQLLIPELAIEPIAPFPGPEGERR